MNTKISVLLSAALLCGGIHFAVGAERWLDAFDLSSMSCGYGLRPRTNRSLLDAPLALGAGVYKRGVSVHADSVMTFVSDGGVSAFDAIVGLDPQIRAAYPTAAKDWIENSCIIFRVYADGRKIADTGKLRLRDGARPLHINLAGATNIVLECSDGGFWIGYRYSFGSWCEAKFTCADGVTLRPGSLPEQLGCLTPAERPEPQINGAAVWGVRPGHPVIYRIPVTGVRPLDLTVAGLPDGVTFNPVNRTLGGLAPEKAGDYVLTVTARNAKGTDVRKLTLKVGEAICLTPPLGWNSWNIWNSHVTDAKIRACARAIVDSGLIEHGWSYVNIDDWWQMNNSDQGKNRPDCHGPARTADGVVVPNANFPDMKGLADYVHSFGLKIGLYSSPGSTTCGGCEGSYQHEEIDAKTWADWGYDYVKHDWCSYGAVFNRLTKGRKPEAADYAKPYVLMSRCLRAQNRDIVHAFCQYGLGNVQSWGREAGAQVWRSWGDLKDSWSALINATESYADAYKSTGPGFWCDPDMLVVGRLGTSGKEHPSFLTPNEQYTHISLWSLLNAPMLMGCDLEKLDAFTRNLLANDEILALNQDTLGRQAGRIFHDEETDIWWRPLANGDSAAGIVNRRPFTRTVTFAFKDAGLSGSFAVRDLWRQKELGTFTDTFTCQIPGHATAVIRLHR